MILEELLKKRRKLERRIVRLGFRDIPTLDSSYTGVSEHFGFGSVYNTPLTIEQLTFALALTKHPLVDKLVQTKGKPKDMWKDFNPEQFRDEKVLSGMKILDLGCGKIPSFARCSRKFGADVYTLDVISANEFDVLPGYLSKRVLCEEIEKHLQLDLRTKGISRIIKERTGGEFDLVTSAHLHSGGVHKENEYIPPYNMKGIVMPLLNSGGCYFSAGSCDKCFKRKNEK